MSIEAVYNSMEDYSLNNSSEHLHAQSMRGGSQFTVNTLYGRSRIINTKCLQIVSSDIVSGNTAAGSATAESYAMHVVDKVALLASGRVWGTVSVQNSTL